MTITAVEPIGISPQKAEEIRQEFETKGCRFVIYPDRREDEESLVQRIGLSEAIIISNIPLSRNVLAKCDNLRLIAVAFTGIDHIDMAFCREKGIEVVNAAGYATVAVAELAIGLMLNVYRKITELDSVTRKGGTRGAFLGKEIRGKTVGIIGTGAIGLETAKLVKAFGASVIAYSRTQKDNGIKYVPIDVLLRESDIISVHLPLTAETNLFLDRAKLALCKSNAIIINTARGKVIDNEALAEALRNNKLAGAGIDVFETEPPLTQHPLFNVPNVVLTPHIAFATEESFAHRIEIVLATLQNRIK